MTYILAVVVSVLFLIADRVTKYIVVSNMALGESIPFIPKFMDFTYIHNTGGAWGLFSGHTIPLIIFTLIVVAICVIILIKEGKNNPLMVWAMSLILSGGIGNMIDRITNDGRVVDFLHTLFIEFPIFNIADCAVCIGAELLILYYVIEIIKESKANKSLKGNSSDE